MGRERVRSLEARLPGRLQSALAEQRARTEERRLSHEQGHTPIDPGAEQEIVTFPQFRECLDTKVFNQSVTRDWVEDSNPREDAWSPRPSRIGPSS